MGAIFALRNATYYIYQPSYSKELKGSLPEKKSLGMSLTRERIELLNKMHGTHSDFKILDLFTDNDKPAGTRVELVLPGI